MSDQGLPMSNPESRAGLPAQITADLVRQISAKVLLMLQKELDQDRERAPRARAGARHKPVIS